ncbi:MAG: InlB B-repeat-containing protein [Alphaproteobacteria bacterium]|nr:InlB B-repeat-containing protein [Alphaproteobacteria bacterium]
MGRKRSFLGFLATLAMLFVGANAFAAAYSCPTTVNYTSCSAGYYLAENGTYNDCYECPDNSGTGADNIASGCTCNTGYSVSGDATDKTLATQGSPCKPIETVITLTQIGNAQGIDIKATQEGTKYLYTRYGSGTFYSDPTRTTAISEIELPELVYTIRYETQGGSLPSGTAATATSECAFGSYGNSGGTYVDKDGFTREGLSAQNRYTSASDTWYLTWGSCGNIILPTPTKTGYKFTGWSDGTNTYAAGASYTPSGATTTIALVAQWQANCNEITINYTANGADTEGWTKLYKLTDSTAWYGGSNCVLDPFTHIPSLGFKDNATAAGLFTSATGRTQVANGYIAEDDPDNLLLSTTWTVKGPTTLYAQYDCYQNYRGSGTRITGACTGNGYKITLDGNGATSSDTTALYTTYGTNVYLDSPRSKAMTTAANAITKPTRTGYNFKGYYSAASGGLQYVASTGYITSNGLTVGKNATADTTWYAQWTPIDSRFTFVASQATSATNAAGYVYTRYDSGAFLDSDRTQAMSTSANPIYVPSREYTVTYDANGGSVSKTSDTARYTFNGYWTAISGGTQYFAAEVLPSGTGKSYITEAGIAAAKKNTTITELYAQWTDGRVTLPTPERDGYVFKGWYTTGGEEVGDADKTYAPTSTVTLYAQWTVDTYTVSFDLNGGSGSTPSSVTQPYGSDMQPYEELATTPYKTGYTFMGWYDNKTYTSGTKYYNADGTSARTWDKTDDATLYAGWEANTFTVSYAGNGNTGGSAPTSPTSCTYGSTCAAPSNAYTKTGYVFVGWACTGGTTSCDGDIIQPGASLSTVSTGSTITLTAQWVREYTKFTIDNAGGSSSVSEIYLKYDPSSKTFSWVDSTKSTAITKIAIPTRAGHTFTGYAYNPCQYRDTGCALSICFGLSSGCSVDITKTDLTTLKSVSGVSNENYFYFTTDLANENETWTMSANWTQCTGLPDDNAYWTTSTNNTCVWACNACVKGTNAASCSVSKETDSCTYSGTCNVDTYNPTVSGVTVSCSDCPTGSNAAAGNTATSCAWNNYSVTYSCGAGDGTEPAGATATYNSNFTPAANTCSRDGYNFSGWSVSGTSDVKAAGTAFPWTYVEDKTFTAVWVLQGNKAVTYETNGGTINDTSVVSSCNVETATFNLPTNVTKIGYTFAGWYESSDFSGSAVTSVAKGSCLSDLKFYAKWDANAITVVYDGDGQTSGSVANQTCYYDQDCIVQGQGNLLKTNYVFSYWTYNSTLYEVGTNIKNIITGGTVTLTATWKLEYTRIDLGDNGGSGGSGTIYLKYNLTGGLYNGPRVTLTDSNKADITSVKIPIRKGYVFAGYQYDDCEFLSDTDCFLKHGSSEYWEDFIKADGTLLYPDDIIGYQGITGYRTAKAKWTQCTGLPTNADWTISTNNTCTWACGSEFYQSSGTCVNCPTNAKCDGGATWDCLAGYEKNTAGTACQGKEYTVTLDADGGVFGSNSTATVTATYNQVLPDATMPTRTNYNFMGIYSAKNGGGDQYYDASGTPTKVWTTDGGATLYAHWSLGVFTCTAGKAADGTTCSAGSYCPGGNVTAGTETGANGCERTCPADAAGGTVSSVAGATSSAACMTVRKNVELTDKTGAGDQTCYYNSTKADYSNTCTIKVTSCIAGRYRQEESSTTCILTEIGRYSPKNDIAAYNCSDLSGADSTVKTASTGSSAATQCYNTCSNISITNGTQVPVSGTVYYNGTTIPACEYTTSCADGYAVSGTSCVPKVLKVTLDHNGGASTVSEIYLKYNTGWYSDSSANNAITTVAIPTLAGQTFSGYLYGSNIIVDAEGKLTTATRSFTEPVTITASWNQNDSLTCPAGTYYKGTGDTCTDCPVGSYCEGVTVIQGIGTESGRETCSALNGKYTAAKTAAGATMSVTVSSAAKSDSATDCYATNVEYVSNTRYAQGSQTCYYNESTGEYTDSCKSKTVLQCVAGYYLYSSSNVDCSEVGKGYYSGSKELIRTACPNLNDGLGVTTTSSTSEKIEQCYLGNIWYEPENGHSGHRRSCYHTSDATDTNVDTGYTYNCDVSIIVTCDGGYYDDGVSVNANGERDCVEVGENYYSPEQLYFVERNNEDEQPLSANPGSSTLRVACPAGGTTNGATTSDRPEDCGLCPEDHVCKDGEQYTCSELTNGEYTRSDAGTEDVSGCYKACEKLCEAPTDCPANFGKCTYATSTMNSGIQYYGTTTCIVSDNECPIDWDGSNRCDTKYYMTDAEPYCTLMCKDLQPVGTYDQSSMATLSNQAGACYGSGSPDCDHSNNYVLGEDGMPTVEYVDFCPENATCTESTKPKVGYAWYPLDIYIPSSFCKFTYVCDPGYKAETTGDIEYGYKKTLYGVASTAVTVASCSPDTYTITLDDATGSGGSGTIYQKYKTGWFADDAAATTINKVKVPTKTNYSFLGYYTAQTGGTKTIDTDGTILSGATFTSNTTFYARWSQNLEKCVAGKYYKTGTLTTCIAPYYCSGDGNVAVGETGCYSECPAGGYVDNNGSSTINDCHKIITDASKNFPNGTAQWDCYYTSGFGDNALYSTSCKVVPLTCNAGYYYEGNNVIGCTAVEDKYYSPANDLDKKLCEGGDGSVNPRDSIETCYVSCDLNKSEVPHSTSVTPDSEQAMYSGGKYETCTYTLNCETGYTAVPGASPKCNPNEYTVTLNKNGGSGSVAGSVKCTFNSGSCTLPATSSLSRPGYNVVAKWCENKDGTGTCYAAGAATTTNISATGSNTELFAVWAPAVLKITLSASDADKNADQGPVYLKYATGWYSDAAATKPMVSLGTNLPSKGGEAYVFAGYKLGNVTIIDANGTLQSGDALTATTTDATATVVWSLGATNCNPGYYYPGTGSQCMVCKENHYCPGGKFATDNGSVGGLNACLDGGLSDGGVSATNIGVCYKQQLAYVSPTKNATGTQTCYHDGILGYVAGCKDIEVNTCTAGHYYDTAQTLIDCVEVGVNYYSPDKVLERTACPNGGITGTLTTAAAATECFKTVDFTSASGNGTGTQVCMYTSGEGDDARYATDCREQYVNKCKGGYYKTTNTSIDCDEVGQNYYSAEGDVERDACPNGGMTESKTANAPTFCYKTDTPYQGEHGKGIQLCYYNAETTVYDTACETVIFQECDPGYYWAKQGDKDCSVVDFGNYGPIADENNNGKPTARAACPNNGMTKTATSASADACYLTDVACDVANGSGEHTCNYDASAGAYAANCTACVVTGCDTGYSQVGDECINCPEDSVCVGGEQQTCAELTGGTHTKSDAGTNDVAYCYKECDVIANVAQMSGRDYYGANVADTCEIKVCAAGYTLADGKCVECPEGYVCDPNDPDNPGKPKSCSVLTGGTHTMSDAGAKSVKDCYQQCEPYEVVNGTAVPVEEKAYYPAECDYEGRSDTGNPCEIVDGVCIETSCNYNFELINGVCKPCARENAITYKQNGNCVVESCASGFHPNGQACESDVTGCVAPNALAATQVWNPSKNAFGECIITKCDAGYHLAANACQVDEQVCELEHGIGLQEWNHDTNTWGECIATECDPGYTNDRSQTNELWKQCGRCNNMYSADGDLAASSYVQECEIAACMYQGEKYILENNECRLICNEFEDETGRRYWDNNKKKCIHDCNKEKGYVPW